MHTNIWYRVCQRIGEPYSPWKLLEEKSPNRRVMLGLLIERPGYTITMECPGGPFYQWCWSQSEPMEPESTGAANYLWLNKVEARGKAHRRSNSELAEDLSAFRSRLNRMPGPRNYDKAALDEAIGRLTQLGSGWVEGQSQAR